MIPLLNKRIGKQATLHLRTIQKDIDAQIIFADKVKQAQAAWKKKKSGKIAQKVFTTIETVLDSMHPRKGVCQYCEMNEISPIEHIFPKRHFPERAFKWDNYLRACYNCNSHHKGDKFAVFYPAGSTNISHLKTNKTYIPPPNNDNVFINPREENPQDFMMLDLTTGIFIPVPGVDTRGVEKAIYTCNILGLNLRDNLIRLRKKAFHNYLQKLAEYVAVKAAMGFPELIAATRTPLNQTINTALSFRKEQKRILTFIKNDILDDPFPTVWLELKKQKDYFPPIAQLFAQASEALYW